MSKLERRLERAKLEALKELAYGASHEINNPLANISTRAQLLLRDEEHPERRRMLTSIYAQAMRAHEMIADLMLFASPPKLLLAEVDLNELGQKIREQWQNKANEQSTELTLHRSEEKVVCRADAIQLEVAVGALIRNAFEALGRGGRVELLIRPQEVEGARHLEITVRDNGPGMSANTRKHAFDPFFSGREAGRGLGFGLSKCWRIIREHQGDVVLESKLGEGTQATIFLPVATVVDS